MDKTKVRNMSDLPEWLETQIRTDYEFEAMAQLMGKDVRNGQATDAEVCANLYTASLAVPLDSDATQIYLYLATALLHDRGTDVPEDIRVVALTAYQRETLNEYKRKIYRHRGKAETPLTKAMKEVFKPKRKVKS